MHLAFIMMLRRESLHACLYYCRGGTEAKLTAAWHFVKGRKKQADERSELTLIHGELATVLRSQRASTKWSLQ